MYQNRYLTKEMQVSAMEKQMQHLTSTARVVTQITSLKTTSQMFGHTWILKTFDLKSCAQTHETHKYNPKTEMFKHIVKHSAWPLLYI